MQIFINYLVYHIVFVFLIIVFYSTVKMLIKFIQYIYKFFIYLFSQTSYLFFAITLGAIVFNLFLSIVVWDPFYLLITKFWSIIFIFFLFYIYILLLVFLVCITSFFFIPILYYKLVLLNGFVSSNIYYFFGILVLEIKSYFNSLLNFQLLTLIKYKLNDYLLIFFSGNWLEVTRGLNLTELVLDSILKAGFEFYDKLGFTNLKIYVSQLLNAPLTIILSYNPFLSYFFFFLFMAIIFRFGFSGLFEGDLSIPIRRRRLDELFANQSNFSFGQYEYFDFDSDDALLKSWVFLIYCEFVYLQYWSEIWSPIVLIKNKFWQFQRLPYIFPEYFPNMSNIDPYYDHDVKLSYSATHQNMYHPFGFHPELSYYPDNNDLFWGLANVEWPTPLTGQQSYYHYWLGYEFSNYSKIRTSRISYAKKLTKSKINDSDLFFPLYLLSIPLYWPSFYGNKETFNFSAGLLDADIFFKNFNKYQSLPALTYSRFYLQFQRSRWKEVWGERSSQFNWTLNDYLRMIYTFYLPDLRDPKEEVSLGYKLNFFTDSHINSSFSKLDYYDLSHRSFIYRWTMEDIPRTSYASGSNRFRVYSRKRINQFWFLPIELSRDASNFSCSEGYGLIFDFDKILNEKDPNLFNVFDDLVVNNLNRNFLDRFFNKTSFQIYLRFLVGYRNWFFCDDESIILNDLIKFDSKLDFLRKQKFISFHKNLGFYQDYEINFLETKQNSFFLTGNYFKKILNEIYDSNLVDGMLSNDLKNIPEIGSKHQNDDFRSRGFLYKVGSGYFDRRAAMVLLNDVDSLKLTELFYTFFPPVIDDLNYSRRPLVEYLNKNLYSTIFSKNEADRYKLKPSFVYEYVQDENEADMKLPIANSEVRNFAFNSRQSLLRVNMGFTLSNLTPFFLGDFIGPLLVYAYLCNYISVKFSYITTIIFVFILLSYFVNGVYWYWWAPAYTVGDNPEPGFTGWVRINSEFQTDSILADRGISEEFCDFIDMNNYKIDGFRTEIIPTYTHQARRLRKYLNTGSGKMRRLNYFDLDTSATGRRRFIRKQLFFRKKFKKIAHRNTNFPVELPTLSRSLFSTLGLMRSQSYLEDATHDKDFGIFWTYRSSYFTLLGPRKTTFRPRQARVSGHKRGGSKGTFKVLWYTKPTWIEESFTDWHLYEFRHDLHHLIVPYDQMYGDTGKGGWEPSSTRVGGPLNLPFPSFFEDVELTKRRYNLYTNTTWWELFFSYLKWFRVYYKSMIIFFLGNWFIWAILIVFLIFLRLFFL